MHEQVAPDGWGVDDTPVRALFENGEMARHERAEYPAQVQSPIKRQVMAGQGRARDAPIRDLVPFSAMRSLMGDLGGDGE